LLAKGLISECFYNTFCTSTWFCWLNASQSQCYLPFLVSAAQLLRSSSSSPLLIVPSYIYFYIAYQSSLLSTPPRMCRVSSAAQDFSNGD
jgi:hypothetical protein